MKNIFPISRLALGITALLVVHGAIANTPLSELQNSSGVSSRSASVQAWIYPGPPACNAKQEYSDGRQIDVLKPEYFNVDETGRINLLTEANAGCNGYSSQNVSSIKAFSNKQFVTVSADATAMIALTRNATNRSRGISTLVNFIRANQLTGIELDFEEFGSWSASNYATYKQFVNQLGQALHAINAQLMIDGPPISNSTEQGYYVWRYADFNSLPVDYVLVMAYDYQYDYGAGTPIAPNTWVMNIINHMKSKISDINKIVVGMPSYGYHGATGGYNIRIDTYAQSSTYPGFPTAKQDPKSFENFWVNGSTTYDYQSTQSLDQKRALIESAGIKNISVWHLGGNNWFSQ